MASAICGIGTCTKDAVVSATYFQDGSGRKFACGMHIAKAMEAVLTGSNVGGGTLRVTAIGALSDRVEKTRRSRY